MMAKTTMATLSSQRAKAAVPKEEATPTLLPPEIVARQQVYFRDRIQAARQRALLANIASTKAAGNQLTTATLKRPSAAPIVVSSERRRHGEQFQRALLAAQLAQTPTTVRALRQRRTYFQTRIQSTRQRDLLENISSTKAAGDQLTTASFTKRRSKAAVDSSPAVQLPTNKQKRKEARLANREARRQATRQQIASLMNEPAQTMDDDAVADATSSGSNQPKKFSPLKGSPSTGKVRPGTVPRMKQQQQSTTDTAVKATTTTPLSNDGVKGGSFSPAFSSKVDNTAALESTEPSQTHPLTNDDMMKKEKYGKIQSVGERAYIILKDLGMI